MPKLILRGPELILTSPDLVLAGPNLIDVRTMLFLRDTHLLELLIKFRPILMLVVLMVLRLVWRCVVWWCVWSVLLLHLYILFLFLLWEWGQRVPDLVVEPPQPIPVISLNNYPHRLQ